MEASKMQYTIKKIKKEINKINNIRIVQVRQEIIDSQELPPVYDYDRKYSNLPKDRVNCQFAAFDVSLDDLARIGLDEQLRSNFNMIIMRDGPPQTFIANSIYFEDVDTKGGK